MTLKRFECAHLAALKILLDQQINFFAGGRWDDLFASDQGVAQAVTTVTLTDFAEVFYEVSDGFLSDLGILVERLDHHLDGNGQFAHVPDVVIGHVCHDCIAQLSFAC